VGRDTDRDWNALAELDPFWAVLTHDEFRGDVAADQDKLKAFIGSGETYVTGIWEAVESALGGPFRPERALDFGCGVGRISIPLAERCGSVVGVDVADRMLAEARALCERLRVPNVRFVTADDALSQVDGTFDLVHSFIVLQHIAPRRGLRLIQQLTSRLSDNGVGVLHVLYYNPDLQPFAARVTKAVWRSVMKPFRERPEMQMNAYPLNDVFCIIHEAGGGPIHALPTDHGGCLGAVLCFRRERARQRTEQTEATDPHGDTEKRRSVRPPWLRASVLKP
jgi:2-polyprenyl-3-methyl-5-hydroxy-6-metoxy-1,4-benzoquinol methylase